MVSPSHAWWGLGMTLVGICFWPSHFGRTQKHINQLHALIEASGKNVQTIEDLYDQSQRILSTYCDGISLSSLSFLSAPTYVSSLIVDANVIHLQANVLYSVCITFLILITLVVVSLTRAVHKASNDELCDSILQ